MALPHLFGGQTNPKTTLTGMVKVVVTPVGLILLGS